MVKIILICIGFSFGLAVGKRKPKKGNLFAIGHVAKEKTYSFRLSVCEDDGFV